MKKWILFMTVSVLAVILVLIVFFFRPSNKYDTSVGDTESVLYDMDVTNLQSRGVEKMKTVSDDTIYSKRVNEVKADLDLSTLDTSVYATTIYAFQRLYTSSSWDALYDMLNTDQLTSDGIMDFTIEVMKKYLKDVLGDPETIAIFPLKAYEDKKNGYVIVELCAPERVSQAEGNILYDYENSQKQHFTFWVKGRNFEFVPYSVMEGVPIEISHMQSDVPQIVQPVPLKTEKATELEEDTSSTEE